MSKNNKKSGVNLTYLPFKILYYSGQNIFGSPFYWTIINCTIVIGCLFLCLVEPVLHYEGAESIAGALEVGGPCHQWVSKMIVYKWYRSTFLQLIEDQKQFWPLDSEGPVIEKRLTKAFTKVKRGFQFFLMSSIGAEGMMAIRPLFTLLLSGDRNLPIVMYNFIDLSKSPFYEIAYVTDIVYLYVLAAFIVGFDGTFLSLCTGAAGQLVLIKEGMSKLNPKNCKKLLPKYVEHHVFILEFIKQLRRIFSFLLMNQFISSMTCVCMAIYLVANYGTSDIVFTARCSLFAFAGTVQVFIYCFTGAQIKAQMDSVAEAIGECGWWESDCPDLRLAVILITQRAQNSQIFKAGGMVNLDLESFIGVLRMSFSFFTLMQAE